jgi:hypothetical protein
MSMKSGLYAIQSPEKGGHMTAQGNALGKGSK